MSTYNVKIWSIREIKGRNRTTYRIRWLVNGVEFAETFHTRALAESHRAELVSAQRRGLAFDEVSGLPEPMARELRTRSWYDHAIDYVDMQWPRSSAKHRKGIAETLATITPLLLATDRGAPDPKELRAALYGWSFNTGRRQDDPTAELAGALDWVSRNTVKLSALADAALVRKLLDALAVKLDGTPAAAATINRKRAVLSGVLRYAVELRHLDTHPFTYTKWTAPRIEDEIDRRVVVNPEQARRLLDAVRDCKPELEAFFACMHFAALRPEEVLHLTDDDYERPKRPGRWGWFHLAGATVAAGNDWTDDGGSIERRGLSTVEKKATRDAPIVPELADILDRHIEAFPPGPGGRLFVTRRGAGGRLVASAGQPIPNNSYTTAWRKAREIALTPAQARSPLVKRPYDLRHAAVSLWLNAGVPAPQVAEWAGHSVNVLMRVYAKCIDGQEDAIRRRVEAALGETSRSIPADDPDSSH